MRSLIEHCELADEALHLLDLECVPEVEEYHRCRLDDHTSFSEFAHEFVNLFYGLTDVPRTGSTTRGDMCVSFMFALGPRFHEWACLLSEQYNIEGIGSGPFLSFAKLRDMAGKELKRLNLVSEQAFVANGRSVASDDEPEWWEVFSDLPQPKEETEWWKAYKKDPERLKRKAEEKKLAKERRMKKLAERRKARMKDANRTSRRTVSYTGFMMSAPHRFRPS